MKPDRSKKREELSKKLIYLKHEMAKFFDCDATYIKFSDPNYISERPKIEVELMLINREVTSLKKFNTSTYYFDFEVEYIKREWIWYKENFYSYENINDFFNQISVDIKKLD